MLHCSFKIFNSALVKVDISRTVSLTILTKKKKKICNLISLKDPPKNRGAKEKFEYSLTLVEGAVYAGMF